MNKVIKNNAKEPEAKVDQSQECDKESESKLFSVYRNFILRLCLVNVGLMIFFIAFIEATKITGFDATKLILLEICLLVLFVFIVGIIVALTKLRHGSKAKNTVAVLIYVAALNVMVSLLLVWSFFKATPV